MLSTLFVSYYVCYIICPIRHKIGVSQVECLLQFIIISFHFNNYHSNNNWMLSILILHIILSYRFHLFVLRLPTSYIIYKYIFLRHAPLVICQGSLNCPFATLSGVVYRLGIGGLQGLPTRNRSRKLKV